MTATIGNWMIELSNDYLSIVRGRDCCDFRVGECVFRSDRSLGTYHLLVAVLGLGIHIRWHHRDTCYARRR